MNRMKQIMEKQKITQLDLEKMTGINQAEISRIINDKRAISLKTAKKIAKALGYSIEYIWPD